MSVQECGFFFLRKTEHRETNSKATGQNYVCIFGTQKLRKIARFSLSSWKGSYYSIIVIIVF